jgi:hypothetical protein
MTAPREKLASLTDHYVAPGMIEVAPLAGEWFSVFIGRKVTVKRFNITRGEAAELVRVLSRDVLTLDRPES